MLVYNPSCECETFIHTYTHKDSSAEHCWHIRGKRNCLKRERTRQEHASTVLLEKLATSRSRFCVSFENRILFNVRSLKHEL